MTKHSAIIPLQIAAIKSNLPAYTLAWQINHVFQMDLALSMDWQKITPSNEISHHLHYFCNFEDVELNWHLIANKGSYSYFLKTKPNFDYFFICSGEDLFSYFNRALEDLKKAPKVEHIFDFDLSIIKNPDFIYQNIKKNKEFINDLHV
jgi:hypothetical protein